jgi:hypothetical protein
MANSRHLRCSNMVHYGDPSGSSWIIGSSGAQKEVTMRAGTNANSNECFDPVRICRSWRIGCKLAWLFAPECFDKV